MSNTFMKKLTRICCNANLDYRLKAKGILEEGDEESNRDIMRLRYLDALLDMACERFARNFTKAVDGCADEGITGKSNNPEKIRLVKDYLEAHGMEIHPFMTNVMVQAFMIYERGIYNDVFSEDELIDSLYLECTPDWVLYGIEELFYRYIYNEFIEVDYFEDGSCLIPERDYTAEEKQLTWNQFAMYILTVLDRGNSMSIPEYNHELDEDYEPKTNDDGDIPKKSGLAKAIAQAMDTIKKGIKG